MEVPQASREHSWRHPLFLRSLNPMLVVDNDRRYVDANAAASLFLRLPHEAICRLRIDDLTPHALRPELDARWPEFLLGGRQGRGTEALPWDFQMLDGTRVGVDLCSVPDFAPGRHLCIVVFPPAEGINERVSLAQPQGRRVLTKREREVLGLVALGKTGLEVAAELFVSPSTVQTHVVNTLVKLGAKNRAHGIAIALQTGELDLDADPPAPGRPPNP